MITRTPINTDLPISVAEAKALARIDFDDEDLVLQMLIASAAADVEAAGALALLPQTIIYSVPVAPTVRLPVGPVPATADVTVDLRADDGTTTTATGWWIERGRWPVLHITGDLEGTLVITFEAWLAETTAAMPQDIKHAIADQVARLYDERGTTSDKAPSLSPHAARVIARYRGVAL